MTTSASAGTVSGARLSSVCCQNTTQNNHYVFQVCYMYTYTLDILYCENIMHTHNFRPKILQIYDRISGQICPGVAKCTIINSSGVDELTLYLYISKTSGLHVFLSPSLLCGALCIHSKLFSSTHLIHSLIDW